MVEYSFGLGLLGRLFATASHSLADIAANGPGIRFRSLSACREILLVTRSTVTADLLQALDILLHLMAQLALDMVFLFHGLAQLIRHSLDQVLRTDIAIDTELIQDFLTRRPTDTVNIRQGNLDALVIRDVDTCDSYHSAFIILVAAYASGYCK